MGFFRATILRVSCTLHPDLPCDRCCRALFNFTTWAVRLIASSLVVISLCTVPPDPFFRTDFLRSYFGLVYRALFLSLFFNLASDVRIA